MIPIDTLVTLATGAAIGAFAASIYFGAKLAKARHGYIRVEAFDHARDKIEGLDAELRRPCKSPTIVAPSNGRA